MKWLEDDAGYVRVISFDLSKAFDTVPHDIICEKLKATDLNPYIINWIINFISNRKQRVVVDGIETEYVHINRGVPQGTVLGPFLFSLMANDIKPKDPENNMLVKFADDMTVSAPVKTTGDTAFNEVKNISDWANENKMIVISKRSLKQLPPPIDGIRRKKWIKLLGVKFQDDPCCWDLHVDELLSKASGRWYILRVCKSYGYASDQLTKLFETLILSLFTYAIKVWGSALLKNIDQFFKRARRYGYTTKEYEMSSLIEEKDRALFRKITKDTEHILYDLLPEMKHRTFKDTKS